MAIFLIFDDFDLFIPKMRFSNNNQKYKIENQSAKKCNQKVKSWISFGNSEKCENFFWLKQTNQHPTLHSITIILRYPR